MKFDSEEVLVWGFGVGSVNCADCFCFSFRENVTNHLELVYASLFVIVVLEKLRLLLLLILRFIR